MAKLDFKRLMNPRSREMQEAKYAEIERLYGLPDRWLARELVTLSRHVVRVVRGHCVPDAGTVALLVEVVPEIAARLGESAFLDGERTDRVRRMSGDELRGFLASSLYRDPDLCGLMDAHPLRGFNAYSILVNDACNGNPAAFGLDRFTNPDPDRLDRLAWEVYAVSGQRGHDGAFGWRPEFNREPVLPPDWFVAPEVRI